MSYYETAFLLDPNLNDKDVEKFTQEVRAVIEKLGATEIAEPRVERRALAYPIKKHKEGYFVFLGFTGPATLPEELRVEFRHREDLLRHTVVNRPKPEPEPEAPTVEPEPTAVAVEPTPTEEPKPPEPPAEEKPAEAAPSEAVPGEAMPTDEQPAETVPGDPEPNAEANAGETTPEPEDG